MFTGLVAGVGHVHSLHKYGPDARMVVATTGVAGFHDVVSGESIAVNGCCLTALEPGAETFAADVSAETLAHTTLGHLGEGSPVNLERSLTPESRLGGHFVTGHVDGLARCVDRRRDGESWRLVFSVPDDLARYIARKGSVALDGISLTVNGVSGNRFDVNIIPHTLEVTNLQGCREGDPVNLEVDLIARYLERLMGRDGSGQRGGSSDELRAKKS